jgi:hypothetical protein
MLLARCANLRDDSDYKNASGEGDIIVSIVVLQFPPKLSERRRVRTELR